MTEAALPRSLHIAFCVDDHYFRSMGATIASILAHNPEVDFTFHVFAFKASDDQRARLKRVDQLPRVRTELHLIDEATFAPFKDFLAFSHYSLSIYSRFVIPATLAGVAERVLYLDADILCVGKVDELITMDLSQDIAGVIGDTPTTRDKRVKALGLKHPRYFNSGAMLINVANWNAASITEAAMAALQKLGKALRFSDQDALNIALDGRARFIATRWNYIYDLVRDLDHNVRTMQPVGNAVFLHFAGAVKPWAQWAGHDAYDLWAKYHAQSPWADMPLDAAPRNSKELRMLSRFQFKHGEWWAGVRTYWRYLRARSR